MIANIATIKYGIAISVAKIEHAIAAFVWNIGDILFSRMIVYVSCLG